MDEDIVCRKCDSHYCKGCNLKNLEIMLNNGKFDCLMNENHCINPSDDIAPVRHGRWSRFYKSGVEVDQGFVSSCCDMWNERRSHYCPNCGARMDGGAD